MIIAGVGLEQDVTMENVDMKTGPETGTAGMAGSADSPHLLYFMILSVFRAVCGSIFGRLQAVGRYVWPPQGRRADRTSVLLLPTLCLALAFVFFNSAGAMAQLECNPGDPCSMPNPEPVAEAGEPQTVASGAMVQLEGSGTDTSPGMITTYSWSRTGGTTGRMVMFSDAAIARPTFTADRLAAGADDVTHILSLTVTDDSGQTHTDTVTITVIAALVADAGPDQPGIASGGTVTLDGSGSTATSTGRTVTYAWTRPTGTAGGTGSAVTLSDPSAAQPTFTAQTLNAGAESVTYIFTLTVTDNQNSDPQTDMVTITVIAALVADAGPDQPGIASGGTVTLDGSGSTATSTGRTVTYAWTRPTGTAGGTGSAVTLSDPSAAQPTFTAQTLNAGAESVTYIFTLTVTDNQNSDPQTDMVTITVIAALVADAGPDQPGIASGGTVTLDGSGSTATSTGRTVTYAWTRPTGTAGGTGSAVTLSDPSAAQPTFTAQTLNAGAESVTYIFTLTVTDNQNSDPQTDMVTITVIAALVADAGPDQPGIASGGTVTLDGSGSTATSTGRTVTYAWTRPTGTAGGTGSAVTLSDPSAAQPTFTAQTLTPGATAVTYIFTLTVTDNQNSDPQTDMVTITVIAALVADAGPDQPGIASGGTVTLDGSGSTATSTGRTVTYAWTRPTGTAGGTGSAVTLSDPSAAQPTFTAQTLTPGATAVTYIFTLTVTDNQNSDPQTDMVTITVIAALVADAGPDQPGIASGGTVTLDGSGSTATSTGRTVTYAWTRPTGTAGGTGSAVTLSDPSAAQPTFTAQTLNAGAESVTYIFTLTVTDNQNSDPQTDMVTITVIAALVADAGPDQPGIASGGTVTLDGSGSTATSTGRTVTYAWTRPTGTAGGTGSAVTLSDPSAAQPTFTAQTLTPGATAVTYIFTLTVTDNQNSDPQTDMVTITVLAALVADAGPDQPGIASSGTVTLDGSGSTATSTGRTVTYAWTRPTGTAGGTGSAVTLSDPSAAQPTFTAQTLNAGATAVTYIFTLTVTDNQNSAPQTDMVTITVIAALVADAGPDQPGIASGGTVTLDGSGSTATSTGRTVTYAWTRPTGTAGGTGSAVTLSDPSAAQPTFTAQTLTVGAESVTYIFTLTVTDNQNSAPQTDMVTITVIAALVADAGPDQPGIASGGTVTLDGSGSTATSTGRTVTYAWTRPTGTAGGTGSAVTLSDPSAARPTFTAQTLTVGAESVTYIFTLTVTDNQNSDPQTDMVTITVIAALVADAGPDQPGITSGGTVTLDGSGSTATSTGRTVTYLWTRASGTAGGTGSAVSLSDPSAARPTFTAQTLNAGAESVTYIFTLTVTDNQNSAPQTDTVTITVTAVPVNIVLDPSDLKVQEGGSGTYRVRLSEATRREVVIMATSGNEGVVRLKNTRLVFNAGNWNDWQEVEVNAVADSVENDDRIKVTITHSINGVASNQLGTVTVTVRAQEDDPILDHVGQFIATRATALLGQQPDLVRFLKQDGPTAGDGGAFTFQATDGRLSLDGGFIHDGIWGEVTGARINNESSDTESVLASFGIHRKYSETFLAGAMLQFDLADRDLSQQAGTIDGTGWLVGPYFVARHGSQPLYFEGRLLYGQSDNDIRFIDPYLGVRTGSFDSARLLAQIRVEGEIAVPGHGDDGGADAPRLIPYADIRWVEDRAAAFTTVSATTGFRTPVLGQTVNISQLELGSNMVIPVAVRTGSMILTGGLGLVLSNTEGDHIKSVARGRARGELGFSYGLDDNLRIGFDSFYDGIGASRYESYGLSLSAEIKF